MDTAATSNTSVKFVGVPIYAMADKNCEVPVDSTCLSGPKGIAVPPNFCSKYFATKGQTFSPRSVVTTESGDVLVLDRGRSPPAIVSLHDDDNNGVAESLSIIAEMDGLNHGLVVYKNFVYASSDTTVWRWPYKANQRVKSTSKEVVVKNINANGQGGAPVRCFCLLFGLSPPLLPSPTLIYTNI